MIYALKMALYQYMFPYGFYADIPVTIGLQEGFYSTSEDSGSVQICVEVVSGDTAGRSLSINYTTVDGSARGTKKDSTLWFFTNLQVGMIRCFIVVI